MNIDIPTIILKFLFESLDRNITLKDHHVCGNYGSIFHIDKIYITKNYNI